jgi:hypothetical protein
MNLTWQDPSFSWGTHVVCQYFTSACLVDGGGLVKAAQVLTLSMHVFESGYILVPKYLARVNI